MKLYEPPKRLEMTPLYLSATDGGIEHSINRDPKIFWNSFVYNFLFTEGGVVIPDVFFFNNKFIIEHLAGRDAKTWPLLLAALDQGKVIPAFRQEGTESFQEALSIIGTHQIMGVERAQYELWNTSPYKLAERLDDAVRDENGPTRIEWPSDMGSRFGAFITSLFGQESLPSPMSDEHAELWRAISPWREQTLVRASELTRIKGGSGVRRAEMFNALGEILGFLDSGQSFAKPRELVEMAANHSDERTTQAVAFFVDAINAIYQKNQADEFKIANNAVSAISPVAMSLFAKPEADRERDLSFTAIDLRLPSASQLLDIEGDELIRFRESGAGKNFFAKRARWIANTDERLDGYYTGAMQEAAIRYANKLSEVAGGPSYFARFVAFSAGTAATVEALKTTADLMKDVHNWSPYYSLAVGAAGASLTALLMYRPPTRKLSIEIVKPPNAEIDFPRSV
jgi:hypothetical protein